MAPRNPAFDAYLITAAASLKILQLRRSDISGSKNRPPTEKPKPKTDKRKAVKAARKQRRMGS